MIYFGKRNKRKIQRKHGSILRNVHCEHADSVGEEEGPGHCATITV